MDSVLGADSSTDVTLFDGKERLEESREAGDDWEVEGDGARERDTGSSISTGSSSS